MEKVSMSESMCQFQLARIHVDTPHRNYANAVKSLKKQLPIEEQDHRDIVAFVSTSNFRQFRTNSIRD